MHSPARAIDNYLYREGCLDEEFLSLCKMCHEEPYEASEQQEIDYDAIMYERNELPVADKCVHDPEISEDGEDGSKMESDLLPNDSGRTGEMDSVDEYSETPRHVHSALSTLGRIAEIWADTSESVDQAHAHHGSLAPRQNVENILSWAERITGWEPNEELNRLQKKMLAALGEANHADFPSSGDCIDVAEDAKVLVDKILSTSVGRKQRFVDAFTVNSYLLCLRRSDPQTASPIAEKLLDHAISGDKYDEFKNSPRIEFNIGTFNTVMEICASLDGSDSKERVNSILSSLEAVVLEGNRGIRPNRKTFKLLLSVNSKDDSGRFCCQEATVWMDRIRQLSSTLINQELKADADLYSAALQTIPRRSPLNTLTKRFEKGLKTEEEGEVATLEAEQRVQWLHYTEACGLVPGLAMYESVIQSWVETETKRGLIEAEEWAKRSLQMLPSKTRLHLFRPIIAAWAASGWEPRRVRDWIDELASASSSESLPSLDPPDLEFRAFEVIANGSYLARLTADAGELTEQDSSATDQVEKIFHCARTMSRLVVDLLPARQIQVSDFVVATTVLREAVIAWGNASQSTRFLPHDTRPELDASISVDEMLRISKMLYSTDSQLCFEQETIGHQQGVHNIMGDVFAETVRQLHQVDKFLGDGETNKEDLLHCGRTRRFFVDKIAHVERMLREYESYSREHLSQSSVSVSSVGRSTRLELYRQILVGCHQCYAGSDGTGSDFGHVARLSKLIMDQLSYQHESCHVKFTDREDITDIYVDIASLMGSTITESEVKMNVLRQVFNNASVFFARKKRFESSNYCKVDKHRIIGALRVAMGSDSELTEPFIRSIERDTQKKRETNKKPRREANAVSYIHSKMNE